MNRQAFLKDVQNWDNHRYLLWEALQITPGGQVIEMGMGYGSTPFLSKYCAENKRELISFENNIEWLSKMKELYSHPMFFVSDWDNVFEGWPNPDVLFIDHAPGERRHIDLIRFSNTAKIIVIHDSEPAASGYMLDKAWPLYKYRKDYRSPGAWASAVSNFIDVTKWEIKNPHQL